MNIDLQFFANSVVLFAIILALTGFKVFSCKPFKEDGEDFQWKKLLLGLSSNLGVLILLSFVYYVGSVFGADLTVVQVGEQLYTIQAALNILIVLAVGVYGVKLYKNAVLFFGLGKEAKEPAVNPELEALDYNVADENVEKG